MKKPHNQKPLRLYLWIALAFLSLRLIFELHDHPETFAERTVNNLWHICFVLVLNYILFEYSLPFIGRKRSTVFYNILVAFPVLFAHAMLYAWGLYGWRLFGIALGTYTPLTTYQSTAQGVSSQMAYSMASVVFFAVVRHVYLYLKLRQAARQLRFEKQQAELNYLKSQTNPHFLFNTLNNIYSLARDKSDLAPESIMRLSKMLRYMLYETGGDYVAAGQELKIIGDYIALERLRYDESLRINFNYDVEDMKQAIPPLLLMPLVENAFKHGVSETRNQPFVEVHLSIQNRQLTFVVKNSTERSFGEAMAKENIGLSNLRRQLELLYADYQLSVKQEDALFTAELTINLASHV